MRNDSILDFASVSGLTISKSAPMVDKICYSQPTGVLRCGKRTLDISASVRPQLGPSLFSEHCQVLAATLVPIA